MASTAARRLPWVVHWHADVVASLIDRRLALAYRLYRPLEQRLLAASQAIIATSPPVFGRQRGAGTLAGTLPRYPTRPRSKPYP